ncbi:MAG: hypothetical protein ABI806_24645, partial [Candidatus Solibacter sp.]
WLFCRTLENPTPGTFTAKQTAAGCTLPDDWGEVKVTNGVQPPGASNPGMVYDTVTKKIILFGGDSGTYQNQTWAYDVPSRTWTRKAMATAAPPVNTTVYWAMPAMAYNPATHQVIYHQTGGTGAPADWAYDTVADTWTKLASTGGAAVAQVLAYDPVRNMVVGFNTYSGGMEVWHGVLSASGSVAPPVVTSACDLNLDGVVDALDVQLAITKALGGTACGAGDLNRDSLCNVVDVQRVVNASRGAACNTTPIAPTAGGSLVSSLATPPATVQLATEGTLDWAHWGLATASDFNHKAGVASKISTFTSVLATPAARYADNLTTYSWTAGTPAASAVNTPTGVYIAGGNQAFRITVPADTTQRTLKVYVGVWQASGTMVAHLSDMSAPDYTNNGITYTKGKTALGVYTFTYKAASSGQTLTVTFTQGAASTGNIALQAATLSN